MRSIYAEKYILKSIYVEKVLEIFILENDASRSDKREIPTKSLERQFPIKLKAAARILGHVVDNSEINLSHSIDQSDCKILICWDFRGPFVPYGGDPFEIEDLLFDTKFS